MMSYTTRKKTLEEIVKLLDQLTPLSGLKTTEAIKVRRAFYQLITTNWPLLGGMYRRHWCMGWVPTRLLSVYSGLTREDFGKCVAWDRDFTMSYLAYGERLFLVDILRKWIALDYESCEYDTNI